MSADVQQPDLDVDRLEAAHVSDPEAELVRAFIGLTETVRPGATSLIRRRGFIEKRIAIPMKVVITPSIRSCGIARASNHAVAAWLVSTVENITGGAMPGIADA